MQNELPEQPTHQSSLGQSTEIGLPTALGIAGIVFVCFSPSLDNFFAGDDFSWFFHTLKTIHLPETFFLPVNNFYRQTESLYFLATTVIFGKSPFPFFLILVLVHVLNAILVASLIAKISGQRLAGIVGGLAWALCYKHAEVVLRPYAIADSAALLFGLGSLLLILKKRILYASLLFIPALFAKENAVLFPLLATLLIKNSEFDDQAASKSKKIRRWIRATIQAGPLWALAGAFALLEILGSRSDRYLSLDIQIIQRFWESWITYLGPDTTWIREVVLDGAPTLIPLWLALALFIPFALAIRFLPRLERLGVIWTCITMVPTLAVPFQSSRYHYVPLVGVGLIFGVVWFRLYSWIRRPTEYDLDRQWAKALSFVLLFLPSILLGGFFIVGIQNEESDTAQIGELHRQAASSFEVDIMPNLDRHSDAMTVFLRTENLEIANSLFKPRQWFMPETYKWVYRRPHGVLGLANTYGFVSYCTYESENPTLFVSVPREKFREQLSTGSFSVVVHFSATNIFSIGRRKERDEVQMVATDNDYYSVFQPGRFDPTFEGIDHLFGSNP